MERTSVVKKMLMVISYGFSIFFRNENEMAIKNPQNKDVLKVHTVCMASQCTKRIRTGSDPGHIRVRSGSDPDQIWIRSVSELGQIWVRSGSDLERICIGYVSELGRSRVFSSDFVS